MTFLCEILSTDAARIRLYLKMYGIFVPRQLPFGGEPPPTSIAFDNDSNVAFGDHSPDAM